MSERQSRRATGAQPPEHCLDSLPAYEQLSGVYDLLGLDRFSQLALGKCRDFLADSGLVVRRLLDLACGTGHFAVAMAQKGVEVTGVDGARRMLTEARRNARRCTHPPRWRHGELTSFSAPGRFDLITCWFDSLNHLITDRQLLSCFRRVRRHLVPGGAFLFDVNTPAAFRDRWTMSSFRSTRDYALHQHGLVQPDSRIAWLELEIFVRRGKRYERLRLPFCQRALTAGELIGALKAARFSRVQVSAFDAGETQSEAARLFVVARP